MTSIQGDYLVTDDKHINLLFTGQRATKFCLNERERVSHSTLDFVWGYSPAQVREALKPEVGRAVFWIREAMRNDMDPNYTASWNGSFYPDVRGFAVNALTIGLTCGELRVLWEWANKEEE